MTPPATPIPRPANDADADAASATASSERRHWKLTRRLTLQLLAGWFGLTCGIVWFARALDGIVVFGWPLSFYLAAQGATLGYLVIVGLYAWRMRRLDRRYHAGRSDGSAE